MNEEVYSLAEQLGHLLSINNLLIATAESCTGGGIAQAITDIPGSSGWFDRGFVTNIVPTVSVGIHVKTLCVS